MKKEFQLPRSIPPQNIVASLNDGVLEVKVFKAGFSPSSESTSEASRNSATHSSTSPGPRTDAEAEEVRAEKKEPHQPAAQPKQMEQKRETASTAEPVKEDDSLSLTEIEAMLRQHECDFHGVCSAPKESAKVPEEEANLSDLWSCDENEPVWYHTPSRGSVYCIENLYDDIKDDGIIVLE